MSKHRCPLCERKGWEVKRRTWKLWREAVRDGIPVLDYSDSPAVCEQLPDVDPRTVELVKFGKAVRQRRLADANKLKWNALDAEFAAGSEERSPQTALRWAKAKRKEKDADWALNYAEKKNEKLAKNRAYNRDYYQKNKERIDRLRKARLERQAGARRSPNTGAKTNGH